MSESSVLLVEPFYGGSHKQLIDMLIHHFKESTPATKSYLMALPAKKWHWRARTSALFLSQNIPKDNYKVLFCSSVLNLAELIALRSDLSTLRKIIYFHENQLVYPVRKQKDRDFQYGYNQILSAIVADVVIFNSFYNLNSFLDNIKHHFKLQPDYRPKDLANQIKTKCKVIYFPIDVEMIDTHLEEVNTLHIIWPHRWEHDKNPAMFFETLFKLKENSCLFLVSVLGEPFQEEDDIFDKARAILGSCVRQWGRLDSKFEYINCLRTGHVVVSTAKHEFFGVAMLEAVSCGCFPLACNDLVYPEIYPDICLYNTSNQLYKKLKNLCERPYLAKIYLKQANIDLGRFNSKQIMRQFDEIFSGIS